MGEHLIDMNDDGLMRVMSCGGLFIEAHPHESFACDTVVMDDVELWALLFESGLDPTRPDSVLTNSLIRKSKP